MRVSLIITAAGASTRFNSSLPKQKQSQASQHKSPSKLFFELSGVSVLERTLRAFENIPAIQETIVTISPPDLKKAQAWAKQRKLHKMIWVAGGKTRAESVLNGLRKTSANSNWVMVHDGARPLIAKATIEKMLTQTKQFDGLLLAKKVVPTLKKVSDHGDQVLGTVDRSNLAEAETPQLIKRQVLLKAYKKVPRGLSFTDESSLIEAVGGKMGVLLHTDWNPKITHFSDFQLAEARLNSAAEFRIGNGYDIHRLVPGRKLWIGGVWVPFEKGSLGHSDGDALLHSITDAILGALGLGDIGDWFSDRDAQYKNIASSKLLLQVLEKANELGWAPTQVDANVILEKPKLGPTKLKIRKNVAKLLKLPLTQVSIKARTYEGLPPIGTGEAWACQTLVMMKRGK